jgi:RNA polymerase sigma-70 factor (ECF subfamily)
MGVRRSREEFVELYDSLFPQAFLVARRLVGDAELAEDLAAEAFARAFARWERVRRHPAPEAWILRTTTNLAIDSLRRRRPDAAALAVVDPEDAVALRLTLVAALGSLSRRQREIVVLRYLADLPEKEVAETLGISAGTVKTHLHRALQRLRDDLDPSTTAALAPEA